MATLKLKKSLDTHAAASTTPKRAPIRGVGSGVKKRPTLAQAQKERAEQEKRSPIAQNAGRRNDANARGPSRRDEPRPSDAGRKSSSNRPETSHRSRNEPQREPGARRDSPARHVSRGVDARHPPGQSTSSSAPPRTSNTQGSRPPRDANFRDQRRPESPPQAGRGPDKRPYDKQRNNSLNSAERSPTQARPSTAFSAEGSRDSNFRDDRQAKRSPGPARGPSQRTYDKPRRSDADHSREGMPASQTRHFESDKAQAPSIAQPGTVRLSKRMSELGIASRREADEWIAKAWVRVDGHVVKELGSRVLPGQHISIDAQAKCQQGQKVTVLMNKPMGYVSGQAEDGYEPAVVLVTAPNQWSEDASGIRFIREHLRNLVPAGRLDIDSTGLLVLTQDGRIAKQLIGADSEVEKEYMVRVQTESGLALPDADLALLNHGLELDGQALLPAVVEWINDDQLRFVLQEGKKRQIRRMCEAVGMRVLGLKRVRIGTVMLGHLAPGQWRYLRVDESFVAQPNPT